MKTLIITSPHPQRRSGIVAVDLYNSLKEIDGNEVKIITKPYDKFSNPDFFSYESKANYYASKIFRKFKTLFTMLKLYKPRLSQTDKEYAIQDYDQTRTRISTKKFLKKVAKKWSTVRYK